MRQAEWVVLRNSGLTSCWCSALYRQTHTLALPALIADLVQNYLITQESTRRATRFAWTRGAVVMGARTQARQFASTLGWHAYVTKRKRTDGKVQPGLHWSGLACDVASIKWQPGFQAERISRSKPCHSDIFVCSDATHNVL